MSELRSRLAFSSKSPVSQRTTEAKYLPMEASFIVTIKFIPAAALYRFTKNGLNTFVEKCFKYLDGKKQRIKFNS
jgi:hypothetical protein